MINIAPICPRSNYPEFKRKKFDYSRNSNIEAYLKTSFRLGVNPSQFGPSKIDSTRIQTIIDKISNAETIHERTVYSDQLWDAYDSYEEIIKKIQEALLKSSQDKKDIFLLLIKYLKADTGLNRRLIDGKHYIEVEKDTGYFKNVATIAKQIITDNSSLPQSKSGIFSKLSKLLKK